jgi:hypothetical protein
MAKTYTVYVTQNYTTQMQFSIDIKSDLDEDEISSNVESLVSGWRIARGIDEDAIKEIKDGLKDIGEVIDCSDVSESGDNSDPDDDPFVEYVEEK